MANIKPYTDEIANAVYGEEVRNSIINALNKVNDDNDSYQDIKNQIVASKDDVNETVAELQHRMQQQHLSMQHPKGTQQSLNLTMLSLQQTQQELT